MFLSIIVPVYRTEDVYLRACLDSCLCQDIARSEYEIICVSDGSTAENLATLTEYAERFDNVRVFSQENAGVSVSRNRGLEEAHGDFVWFTDSDDLIAENCLGAIRQHLTRQRVDHLQLGTYRFEGETPPSGDLRPNMALHTPSGICSVYDRQFLLRHGLRFEPGLSMAEDVLLNFRLRRCNGSEDALDAVIYFYRVRHESLTNSADKERYALRFIDNHLLFCRCVRQQFDILPAFDAVRFLHADLAQTLCYIASLPYAQARQYLRRILREHLPPFGKRFPEGGLSVIYTNLFSLYLRYLCRKALIRPLFWTLRMWAGLYRSHLLKRLRKKFF